ncbi:unnamed protein product [Toxocara canis]|uniref:DEP domain-containing protein n=1 Tax=Toxocara canis TaxID=6265 RepID=A0A183U6V4_TOXCA|nr:unnamed protein product [Toxocara canis]
MKNMQMTDLADALHLAHLIASHGYLFQIDDHVLTVKNDGTFYRFQTPYFWPSNCWEPENTDYGKNKALTLFIAPNIIEYFENDRQLTLLSDLFRD